jgi:hypothetical protein
VRAPATGFSIVVVSVKRKVLFCDGSIALEPPAPGVVQRMGVGGLAVITIGPDGAGIEPVFTMKGPEPKWIRFREWWHAQQHVVYNDVTRSREFLVTEVANTDGGPRRRVSRRLVPPDVLAAGGAHASSRGDSRDPGRRCSGGSYPADRVGGRAGSGRDHRLAAPRKGRETPSYLVTSPSLNGRDGGPLPA